VLTADLDRELAAAISALATDGQLPAAAAALPPPAARGTWRPAPDGNPAGYATSLSLRLARLAERSPADVAAALAARLAAVQWIEAASPAGGYLTVTVTPQALAASAAAQAAAGPACADSTILAGTTATPGPWPDLAAEPGWQAAWQNHRSAMAGRLAQAAGAAVSVLSYRERATSPSQPFATTRSPVHIATDYHGLCSVRYRLARTMPHQVPQLSVAMQPGWEQSGLADPLYPVQQAHAAAASAVRWAGDLGLTSDEPGEQLADGLSSSEEQAMLGLLSFLPVRVAAAARRGQPHELPRYLEQVAECWQRCRLARPALPFGGQAAPRDPATISARLVLAAAVQAVLAAGLALTGVTPSDRL
jgi:arginyl-tRNA synthetase